MCHFITVAVPAGREEDLRQALPRDLHLREQSNPSLASIIPRGQSVFVLTSGHCSCDLFGPIASTDLSRDLLTKRRRKYEKEGWPEAKILRALGQVEASLSKNTGLRPDVRSALATAAEAIGDLWILVHWYSGGVDPEEIAIKERRTLTIDDLREGRPPLGEDELYHVRAVGLPRGRT